MASGMNLKKEKWNRIPQTLRKHSNHFTLPNEMEDFKLSSEMRLKIKREKWDPSHLFSIEGIKWKAPLTHKL
jgi:hypothetical protein